MNELKEILKSNQLHPKSYHHKNRCIIIETINGKYAIKPNTNNYDIYNYLSTRGFNYFPRNYNLKSDNYDLLEYVEDINIPDSQRIEDLIMLISVLHAKTTYYQEIDLDEIKEIYESNKNTLLELIKYYSEINDYLDTVIFLSPSEYLLIRNISLIYYMIDYSMRKLDEWYTLIKDHQTMRFSLIHNNISKDHILINNHKYLISWDKAKNDRPIKDLLSIYKKYYRSLKLFDMLNLYESNNVLEKEEKCLLFAKLAIPKKIAFTSDVLKDTKDINNEILYMRKVYEYIKDDDHSHKV